MSRQYTLQRGLPLLLVKARRRRLPVITSVGAGSDPKVFSGICVFVARTFFNYFLRILWHRSALSYLAG